MNATGMLYWFGKVYRAVPNRACCALVLKGGIPQGFSLFLVVKKSADIFILIILIRKARTKPGYRDTRTPAPVFPYKLRNPVAENLFGFY